MKRVLIAVLAAMLATASAHASGGDARAASEELIARGVDARLREHHEEALDLFRKAHALSPSARTFAQMGLAELSLRRWLDAEEHLETALQLHDVPWIEDLRVREVLKEALEKARGHVGTLVVMGTPGVEVLVEGHSIGRLPMSTPLRLAEGKARVVGSAAGRRASELEVEIVGGHETTTRIDLTSIAPVPAIPVAPTEVRAAVPPPPRSVSPPGIATVPSAPEVAPRWQTWTGVGLLVLSAAAIITGAVFLKIDGQKTCDAPAGVECPELYGTKKLGVVSLVGAALGSAAGITLIAWGPDGATRSASQAPTGVGIAARF